MVQVPKDEIRSSILDTARRHFRARGFRGASLRGIAAETGVSLGNLYNYFDSKDAIFREVLAPFIGEWNRLTMFSDDVSLQKGDYYVEIEEKLRCHREMVALLDRCREDARLVFLYSGGSSLESFPEKFVVHCERQCRDIVERARRSAPEKAKREISPFLIHLIASSSVRFIQEFLHHDLSRQEMEYCMEEAVCYFYHGFIGLLEK